AELAALAPADATPFARIAERLTQEFAQPVHTLFSAIEETPCRFDANFQSHRAWLRDEVPVMVTVLRPEWDEQWAADGELLPLLEDCIRAGCANEAQSRNLVAEFRQSVPATVDLAFQAEALQSLRKRATSHGSF